MPISVTVDGMYHIPKGPSIRIGSIILDNAYPNPGGGAGGWPVTLGHLKLQKAIQKLILQGSVDGFGTYFDHATSKIRVFNPEGVELTNNNQGMNGKVIHFIALGY